MSVFKPFNGVIVGFLLGDLPFLQVFIGSEAII